MESHPHVCVPCHILTSAHPLAGLGVTMSLCALSDGLLLVRKDPLMLSLPLYSQTSPQVAGAVAHLRHLPPPSGALPPPRHHDHRSGDAETKQ